MYNILPSFDPDSKSWGVKKADARSSHLHVGSSEPLPFSSPLADMLTLGDLNVNADEFALNHFDQLSHLYLMNHNVWVYLTAFQEANELTFASDRSQVPSKFALCADAIERSLCC